MKKFLLIIIFLLIAPNTWAANPPVIFYTDILSGPNSGGENNNGAYLTIFGKGFGATRGTSTVTIGGGEVAVYKTWSDTQVSVQLGSSASTGNMVITTSNGVSTASDTFTVRSGSIFFVSLIGTDNGSCGAIGAPCRTPNYIMASRGFTAGDFMVVRGGDYDLDDGTNNLVNSRWVSASSAGTSGNPKTIYGYPGETVNAISDSNVYMWKTATTSGISYGYWVVANLKHTINFNGGSQTIQAGNGDQGCPADADDADADYSRFVNIETYATGGVSDSGSSPVTLTHCSHCKVLGHKIHDSIDIATKSTHVIYLSGTQTDVEIAYNEIYNMKSTRATIQLHHDQHAPNNCWLNDGSIPPIIDEISIHDNYLHDLEGQAILADGGVGHIYIYNNVIHDVNRQWTVAPEDQVIALRASGSNLIAEIYNNTIYGNPRYTSADALLGFGYTSNACPESIILKNNIFTVSESQDIYWEYNGSCDVANFIAAGTDYNLWYGSSTSKPSWDGVHSISQDPLFINTSIHDFHLQSSSPARDSGTTVALITKDYDGRPRPVGSIYDIGAYEFSPIGGGTATQVAFSVQPSNGTSTISLPTQPIIEIRDSTGAVVAGATNLITLALGTNPGGGVLQCTTNPVVAISGVATFSGCKINKIGSGYTLSASSSGLTGTTSNAFNITNSAATHLGVRTQPGGGIVNVSWSTQPAIDILDAGDNIVAGATNAITLTPSSNVLTCDINPKSPEQGSGTTYFSGCSINTAGQGYVLDASSGGLTPITTNQFNVSAGASGSGGASSARGHRN